MCIWIVSSYIFGLRFEVEEFCKHSAVNFFDVLIANISWTVAQTPINHAIFWMNVIKTFRCMYVIHFKTDLGLLLRLSQNFKKCTLLDNLRAITHEANIETRQNHTIFFIYFFQAKATNSKSRYHEIIKNPYYILSPEGSQK